MNPPTTKHKKRPGGQPGRTTERERRQIDIRLSNDTTPSPDCLDARLTAAGLAYELADIHNAGELFLAWLRLYCELHDLPFPAEAVTR